MFFRREIILENILDFVIDQISPLIKDLEEFSKTKLVEFDLDQLPKSVFFDTLFLDYIKEEDIKDSLSKNKKILYLSTLYDKDNKSLSLRKEVVVDIGFSIDGIIPEPSVLISIFLSAIKSLLVSSKGIEIKVRDCILIKDVNLIVYGLDQKFRDKYPDSTILRSLFEIQVSYPRRMS